MVPFMNTSIIVGPAATALDGADLSFYVGFIVTGILYDVLRRWAPSPVAARAAVPVVGVAGEAGAGRPAE
jgi:NCS1 family nucleobase:cation symporter-1